jgi:hypothetical protein
MNQGRGLQAVLKELVRQDESKRDFVIPTSDVSMSDDALSLQLADFAPTGITSIAHTQIAEQTGISQAYYNRLKKDHPDLLANNVNTLFERESKNRMFRTLDGDTRAVRSDSYRRFDNLDLMRHVAPQILNSTDLLVTSAEVTERKLYLKVVSQSKTAEVRKGDVVRVGAAFSNSEIGLGYIRVDGFCERCVCDNGMIVPESLVGGSLRRVHSGSKHDSGELEKFYTATTQKLTDEAFWAQVVDVAKGILNAEYFNDLLEFLRTGANNRIEGNPKKAVEVTAKKYAFGEAESDAVLMHFLQSGDFSQYGLMNAVTRSASDIESYDRATELEKIGGQIITLAPSEWRVISTAV